MQQIQVAKWGRGLGVRIPSLVAESLHITVGDTLELTPSEDGLLIKKARPTGRRYALSDILDSFAPAGTHAEVDFGKPKGEEAW